MRFIFSVALKYLVPRWRQLSVSIISLISVLVISLVVWLVIVFLSVTEGIEKTWVKQLVALNAPLRMTPTDDYYRSYYYLSDQVSSLSNFSTKTIGEKLHATVADPYDANQDAELPVAFPQPDRHPDGSVRDLVKEAWEVITTVNPTLQPDEYEVSCGQLRLSLIRDDKSGEGRHQTFLSQVSYVSSFDTKNPHFQKLVVTPSLDDLNNLLSTLSTTQNTSREEADLFSMERDPVEKTATTKLSSLFDFVQISALRTSERGFRLPRSLFPEQGNLKAWGLIKNGKVSRVVIPESVDRLAALEKTFGTFGQACVMGDLCFDEGRPQFYPSAQVDVAKRFEVLLEPAVKMQARLLPDTVAHATTPSSLQFEVNASIQGVPFEGVVKFEHLQIAEASPILKSDNEKQPLWLHQNKEGRLVIPTDHPLGDGILLAKTFRENDVKLGDTGFLSYYAQTASGAQEQRIPVYVAGFYDPGFMPVGNKLLLVDPKVTALLRGSVAVADRMLGNGIHIWVPRLEDTQKFKKEITSALEKNNLSQYWTLESYEDFEFARPVLEQLKSDKTLFTLIAVIILVVACSNIISMLILLVNDKKKEIGILQSLGASPLRIAFIFGVCGFITGLISSIIGTVAAFATLKHLQALVNLLSFLQGHQAFQSAFYGDSLPNELSLDSLIFVLIATVFISILAGIAPAVKAGRIRPAEMLRAE